MLPLLLLKVEFVMVMQYPVWYWSEMVVPMGQPVGGLLLSQTVFVMVELYEHCDKALEGRCSRLPSAATLPEKRLSTRLNGPLTNRIAPP
jgi:hypothetical protein